MGLGARLQLLKGSGARAENCAGLAEVRREAERLVGLGARLQLLKGSAARAESPR